MRNPTRSPAFCGAAIAISLVALFVTFYDFPPGVDSGLHKAIGEAMARQALDCFQSGGKIIVIKRDTEAFAQPACEIQFEAFRKALAKGGAPAPVQHSLQLDPLRPGEAPAGDFFDIIRKSQPGTVIVSFMGPPLLSPDQRRALRQVKPKIVAFCSGSLAEQVDFKTLFESQLLHGAVVERMNLPAGGRQPSTFDQLFVTVNPSSYGKISSGAGR